MSPLKPTPKRSRGPGGGPVPGHQLSGGKCCPSWQSHLGPLGRAGCGVIGIVLGVIALSASKKRMVQPGSHHFRSASPKRSIISLQVSGEHPPFSLHFLHHFSHHAIHHAGHDPGDRFRGKGHKHPPQLPRRLPAKRYPFSGFGLLTRMPSLNMIGDNNGSYHKYM